MLLVGAKTLFNIGSASPKEQRHGNSLVPRRLSTTAAFNASALMEPANDFPTDDEKNEYLPEAPVDLRVIAKDPLNPTAEAKLRRKLDLL
ncbi:hypothetical protein C8J56DRAFT_1058263 [Mycena floridula]|nr:hypothetical protein C8J56DRAFT_1058263 [Mycena floridula]